MISLGLFCCIYIYIGAVFYVSDDGFFLSATSPHSLEEKGMPRDSNNGDDNVTDDIRQKTQTRLDCQRG